MSPASLQPHPSGRTQPGTPLPEPPLVSVVIPAYNAQATIDDTLTSVRGQTYTHLDILVVDDGSSDDTARVVEQHRAKDGRVTLLRQANAGVAAARNLGWAAAKGDLIAFVDADDLWAPSKIEKQVAAMLAGGPRIGLVYTWFCLITPDNHIRTLVPGRHIEGDVLSQIILENFIGHASSPLVRRHALQRAAGFDSALRECGAHGCEDLLLYQRVAAAYRFGLVPEHLTGYRVAHVRMSSNRLRMLRSFELVANEARKTHPELRHLADAGVRRYLTFLAGEALAELQFVQMWHLLGPWIVRHPWDALLIPAAVIWQKVRWRWGWLLTFLRGPTATLRGRKFPIGSPEADPARAQP